MAGPDDAALDDAGLPAFTRHWAWQSESLAATSLAATSLDLAPGGQLWLAVGRESAELVQVLRWLDEPDRSTPVIRRSTGEDFAMTRQSHSPWLVEGHARVAEILLGEGVWLRPIGVGDTLGPSLPVGHIWPPTVTPPPPATVEGRPSRR